jgi:hypothetical protein
MTTSPWMLEKLAASRMADREAEATAYRRSMGPAMAKSATRASHRFVVTRKAGRILISIGCRLAGPEDAVTGETQSSSLRLQHCRRSRRRQMLAPTAHPLGQGGPDYERPVDR